MSKKNFDCTSRHRFGGWQTLHTDPELKTRSKKLSKDIFSKKIAKMFVIRTTKRIGKNGKNRQRKLSVVKIIVSVLEH